MDEITKAKKFILDKNNSLIELSKKYDIPYSTLRTLRVKPENLENRLQNMAYKRVHLFATLYDKQQ